MLTFVGPVLVLPLTQLTVAFLKTNSDPVRMAGTSLNQFFMIFASRTVCLKVFDQFSCHSTSLGCRHYVYENDTAVALSQFAVLSCLPDCLLTDIQKTDQLLVRICQLNSKKREVTLLQHFTKRILPSTCQNISRLLFDGNSGHQQHIGSFTNHISISYETRQK